MEFSRQEYWSRLSFPSPGDLPDPGIEPESPALQADSLLSESPGKSLNTLDEFKIYEFIMMSKKKIDSIQYIHDKNSQKIIDRREIPQSDQKASVNKLQLRSQLMVIY